MNGKEDKKKQDDTKVDISQEAKKEEKINCPDINPSDIEMMKNVEPKMEAIISLMGGHISRSSSSPIASKVNEEHISKLLSLKEKNIDATFKDIQQERKYRFFYVLIAVLVFIFLTLFLVGKDTELYKEIIKLFIAFVGGIGTGYGIKKFSDKE